HRRVSRAQPLQRRDREPRVSHAARGAFRRGGPHRAHVVARVRHRSPLAPACAGLLQALRESRSLHRVENLTWKRVGGEPVVNPLTFVPATLDEVEVPAYGYPLRSVFKYHSLRNLVPCLEWLRYPTTMLLSARGCTENCAICGGSRSAYERICGR